MDSQQKFLYLLKTRGSLSTQAVSRALSMTKEAARQMLHKLAEENLVQSVRKVAGVGRPTLVWQLTPKGQDIFPDTHGELTVQLINHIRQLFGEEGLNRLITAREQDTRAFYHDQMPSQDSLQAKVEQLARLREEEGYMAEWTKTDDGFLLIENHCPICAAATVCQGFCRAELNTFQAVLGPEVSIKRVDHIVAGARRCAYLITGQDNAVSAE